LVGLQSKKRLRMNVLQPFKRHGGPDDVGEPKPKILAQAALKEVFAAIRKA